VRVVVALIATEGLVQSDSEAELDRKSRDAYRNFRTASFPPPHMADPAAEARPWLD